MTESTDQTVTERDESDVDPSPEHEAPAAAAAAAAPAEDVDADGGDADGGDADGGDADAEPGDSGSGDAASRMDRLEAEGDIAADYLEELLDIADVDGDLDIDVDGDRAAVSIAGGDLSALVGKDGQVLEALQELTRLAVYQVTGERSRLMLDIDGHRASRRAAVERVARAAVERATETGEPQHLEAMSPFERKVAHDVVAAAGLTSESEGVEPRRHVVVLPDE